jgi:glutathione S-transferase
MAYQLFYSPGACSLAAHIVLEEVGAAFELQRVDFAAGDQRSETFLALNPKGRVPVLRIPGEPQALTELPVILFYLARQHPDFGLAPIGEPLAEARMGEQLAWLSGWVHAVGFGLIWRPERFTDEAGAKKTMAARGRAIVEAAFADIEARLADGRPWSMGERFSIVDPVLLVKFRWGSRIGLEMGERYPAWSRLAWRTVDRPAVTRVLEREGVSIEG